MVQSYLHIQNSLQAVAAMSRVSFRQMLTSGHKPGIIVSVESIYVYFNRTPQIQQQRSLSVLFATYTLHNNMLAADSIHVCVSQQFCNVTNTPSLWFMLLLKSCNPVYSRYITYISPIYRLYIAYISPIYILIALSWYSACVRVDIIIKIIIIIIIIRKYGDVKVYWRVRGDLTYFMNFE